MPIDSIFAVTTLHLKGERFGSSPRTVGWFADLATAQKCILENWGDIFETTYTYALIEKIPPGLYASVIDSYSQWWFEWQGKAEGAYVARETAPEGFTRMSGFAMG
jgi:hypothetical protein